MFRVRVRVRNNGRVKVNFMACRNLELRLGIGLMIGFVLWFVLDVGLGYG
jgi:hypothetical protein